MHIHFNTQLGRYTATDDFGVVLSVHNPAVHGSLDDFKRHALALVSEG